MLRRYEWTWLRHDVVAGLVLTTMLVPVGVAYAEASGVPGLGDAIILDPALMLSQILDGGGNKILGPSDIVPGGVDGVDSVACTSQHGAPPDESAIPIAMPETPLPATWATGE
jgi:hypothetical protein